MYARGEVVSQSGVEAYRWINGSAEQGNPSAIAARSDLEQILSPAELNLARSKNYNIVDRSGPKIDIPDFKSIPVPSD